jgi:hypothetical protein
MQRKNWLDRRDRMRRLVRECDERFRLEKFCRYCQMNGIFLDMVWDENEFYTDEQEEFFAPYERSNAARPLGENPHRTK